MSGPLHARDAQPPRARLQGEIAHLAHHLPGQAPLSEFVHHNTLHGDAALGFEAALIAARDRLGATTWPLPEMGRHHVTTGRIWREDLVAVLAERHPARVGERVVRAADVEVRWGDLALTTVLLDAQPLEAATLRWQERVGRALDELLPAHEDLPVAAQAAYAEPGAVREVWRAVLQGLGLTDLDVHPERLSELAPGLAAELRGVGEGGADAGVRAQMLRHADGRIARWRDRLGVESTHRELLAAFQGEDVDAASRSWMVRWLVGFLDEGVGSWTMPGRERGLWSAWRHAAMDVPWSWYAMPDAPLWLTALPDDPLEALEDGLRALGVPEERWGIYLERLALRLPGLFGMVAWRDQRPDWPAQQTAPARLVDALAVRVTLELWWVTAIARRTWGCDARWSSILGRLAEDPLEAMMREALYAGRVPGHLAERCRALAEGRGGLKTRGDAPWRRLADAWWTWNHTVSGNLPGQPTVARVGWPVFRVVLGLGLTAAQVRALSAAEGGLRAIASAIEALGEAERGMVWLCAFERRYRREVHAALVANRGRGRWADRLDAAGRPVRPRAQVAFCIDDREEAIRRHLEAVAPDIETFGVAGFFGVPLRWRGLDDARTVSLCPPVVRAVHRVGEAPRAGAEAEAARREAGLSWLARGRQWLQELRLSVPAQSVAAVTGAAFAVPTVARLVAPVAWERAITEGFRLVAPSVSTSLRYERAPEQDRPLDDGGEWLGFSIDEAADRVAATLRNVGLTSSFSRLVLWLGHGSHSRNNPHTAAYDCGACGGRHGGPNARAFAAMTNNPRVRVALKARGLDLPEDTWFVGAEHDTGDETIVYYDEADVPPALAEELAGVQALLRAACGMSAQERCRKFASAPLDPEADVAVAHVRARAKHPFQARPELGHATNASALVGRRSLTRGLFLDRRMFLISYDPRLDAEARICEGILQAVGPVGSGISLEYYFSTIDNERFGSGTKITHNLCGLIGVMDGSSSDLRTGLPKQMIEVHEPMRLLLYVEQTPDALAAIVGRNPIIAELVLGSWLTVVSIHPETGALARFVAGVGFVDDSPTPEELAAVARPTDARAHYRGRIDLLPPALLGGDHV